MLEEGGGAASVSGENSVVPLEMTACLEAKAKEPSAEVLGAGRDRGAEGSPVGCVPARRALPRQPTAALACGDLVPTRGHLVPRHLLLCCPGRR